jgi:hypothetical protein
MDFKHVIGFFEQTVLHAAFRHITPEFFLQQSICGLQVNIIKSVISLQHTIYNGNQQKAES